MKRFAAFVLSLVLALTVLAVPAAQALTGWLTPEWYQKYYNVSPPTTPDPAPTPPPAAEPAPPPPTATNPPGNEPAPSTPGSTSSSVAWLSPEWYSRYYGNSGGSTTPAQPPASGDPNAGTDPSSAPSGEMTALEAQLFQLLNNERGKRGLKLLGADATLTRLARLKSQDMVKNNYFGHNSPTYGSVSDLLNSYGVSYRTAGENLAKARSVSSAHDLFMNSSVHRATMLSDRFTHVGIGIVSQATGGGVMVTELFIQK